MYDYISEAIGERESRSKGQLKSNLAGEIRHYVICLEKTPNLRVTQLFFSQFALRVYLDP
jgi:hypothetical protein